MDRGRLKKEFWISSDSELIIDSRREPEEQALFRKFFEASRSFKSHVWLASSGSSQTAGVSLKLIGLSKTAILESSRSVNQFLEVTAKDRWGLCLPEFHIGGLSVWSRAFLGQNEVRDYSSEKWNAIQFAKNFENDVVTLVSLVPTQIFDLVAAQIPCPKKLRAIVVGGGALNPDLYEKARLLGWPLLPSFGMTEVCSQVATAELKTLSEKRFPDLKVLSHFDYRLDEQGRLGLSGPSMMTGYWQETQGQTQFYRPESDYFWTSDMVAETKPGYLQPLGRESDFIKILGEGVNIGQVEQRLHKVLGAQAAASVVIVSKENTRTGHDLVILTDAPEIAEIKKAVEVWNLQCLPVERFSEVLQVAKIPRTALGKVQRQFALNRLGPL